MSQTAIYPGTFDPITLGHVDIVTRASRLYSRVILAIVRSPNKQTYLTLDERIDLAQASLAHLKNVEIEPFDGLIVNFAQQHQAPVLIRGLRATSDFEYEFMMSQMNKMLNPQIETMFMMAGLDYQFLSSSLVKEVSSLGGDVSRLVPSEVFRHLEFKLNNLED
ncbi:MAG: pantetheine-phosphate adenylyltransferase [Cyanobacteria bacterium]|nr:pantetheine-phosphate adenylyltransferase [Cyanobacteriota bacterium]